MKPIFSLILLFICGQSLAQETKQVFISCDVLGKKNEHVRYYHPVEGEYQVKLKNHYLPNKKEAKTLGKFVLINPQDYLKDSLTMVQANSLRHQIEMDELIYVNWGLGIDSMNNQAKLDSFSNAACYQRDNKYAEVVQDYFNPFLMSRFEVTNAEYREFVYWVKDSIFRELIYLNSDPTGNDRIDDEVIGEMLVHPDGYYSEKEGAWIDFDPSQTEINRGLYRLNWEYDWRKEIKENQYIPLISDMYLRPNERWYKRRQQDSERLIYKYYSIDKDIIELNKSDDSINNRRYIIERKIPVYPDTLKWKEINYLPSNDPMHNMYFWHPAYDNFPIVGLSFEQIEAYIHWKQMMFEKEHPELMLHYELCLPNLQEIEWAVNSASENYAGWVLGDEEIIPDLNFGLKDDSDPPYLFLFKTKHMRYTEEVWLPFDITKKHKKDYFQLGKDEDGHESLAEIYRMRCTDNSLRNNIEFLSNNVSEWMDMDYQDYEKLLDAYINYNCFADVDYCQYQRPLDANKIAKNDKDGKLIMGSNWYDERYENTLGVNTGGIYPKRFADKDSSFATVGFRLVLRLRD